VSQFHFGAKIRYDISNFFVVKRYFRRAPFIPQAISAFFSKRLATTATTTLFTDYR
jgi:hypothetical protein